MYQVRKETAEDRDAIREVTMAAFEGSEFGHNGEADLVEKLRNHRLTHSLVAIAGEEVVGHVMFSFALIVGDEGKKGGFALGPMSVKPGWQRKGVGAALIEAGLREIGDYLFVVVFGHPEYYPRFGFEPAAGLGVRHGFQGLPQELLFLRTRTECYRDAVRNGRVYFDPAFGAQADEYRNSARSRPRGTAGSARLKTLLQLIFVGAITASAADWPQAAGPNGNFTVAGKAPAEFSVTHGRNVLWRAKLPSTGQGTAIVSNGKVFVTSHEPIQSDTQYGSNIVGICFNAATGKELWRRTIPGVRNTDLSSLFSDNTAASPVADGKRVCFVNVGGGIKCYDYEGREQWSYDWVPFGRHHARLHEPILHDGNVITVQYPQRDLKPIHTTKPGAKPLGRDRKYWTHLQAFDLKTGKREWIAETGTSIHETSLIGMTPSGVAAILTGRGGGHQPPEEPYGMSLVNAADGSTIWDLAIAGYPAAQNACWDGRHAYGFVKGEHVTVDVKTGEVIRRTSLTEGVTITSQKDGKYVTEHDATLKKVRRPITKNTNVRVGRYHYFRSDSGFLIGRVHLDEGTVEYLQVPVQVVRRKGEQDEVQWTKALKNDMKTANGYVATQDKRNAGHGWGHVSAASGTVVGDKLYFPTMIGMVYVIDWNAKELNEGALLSISDLGPATETWTLSSLSFADGRLYTRTLKELVCLGED